VTAKTRQIGLLVTLVAMLGAVITYQFSPFDTADNDAAPSNPPEATRRQPEMMQVAEVHLERLKPGAGTFEAPRRDPFSFRPKPAPPPPVNKNPLPVTTFVPPQAPPPPPVPPIQLKYIGFAQGTNGARVALLSDGNVRPIMTGRQGDVINGQYRLLRVDANEVEMSYLDGTGRRRIPKTGQ
jgi:hypothetical protein